MKTYKYFLFAIIISFLTWGCNSKQEVEVLHSGALMELMSGNLGATVSLNDLATKDHLYALGALEQLQGEILVMDGAVYVSTVNDSTVRMSNGWGQKAALLVYSEVANWIEVEIPPDLKVQKDLEAFVKGIAGTLGIDTDKPFPFLLEGEVERLDWHVINWDVTDKVHTHEKHQNAGLNGKLTDEAVTILGFYSEAHKGIFTHHSSNMHLHFKGIDGAIAGHVDDLVLSERMKLKLPL